MFSVVSAALHIGLWVIAGLLLCFLVEKFCARSESSQHKVKKQKTFPTNKYFKTFFCIQIAAFMNLFANVMDNFTHGLAVGGSFLVNIRVSEKLAIRAVFF